MKKNKSTRLAINPSFEMFYKMNYKSKYNIDPELEWKIANDLGASSITAVYGEFRGWFPPLLLGAILDA